MIVPTLEVGNHRLDFAESGSGDPVILVHSSVSGNRQWGKLTEKLNGHYRVRAPNLYGYGATTSWPETACQSLYAQAQLIVALCADDVRPIHLVGHSFGGSVALKAALLLGTQVETLTLLEPNPFYLLKQAGCMKGYLESRGLRDHVKCFGSSDSWDRVAEKFADYWLGDGAWSTMPENRRAMFIKSLAPNYHEWDAVMDEETPVEEWGTVPARTLLVSDHATRAPIREIAAIFARACPHWSFHTIEGAGHMAPLTHPELVNPIVARFIRHHERRESR